MLFVLTYLSCICYSRGALKLSLACSSSSVVHSFAVFCRRYFGELLDTAAWRRVTLVDVQ